MTKTIPIWAAVVNRAVAQHRAKDQASASAKQPPRAVKTSMTSNDPLGCCDIHNSSISSSINQTAEQVCAPPEPSPSTPGVQTDTCSDCTFSSSHQPDAAVCTNTEAHPHSSSHSGCCSGNCSCSNCWDTAVHLPPWISHNELNQIELRMNGWVNSLFSVGADIASVAEVLQKPLRPLWISQQSLIWVNQVTATLAALFGPLLHVYSSSRLFIGRFGVRLLPSVYVIQGACFPALA